MKPLLSLLLLLIFSKSYCQNIERTIDSIGLRRGQSMEVISSDTVYIYSWRGIPEPKVKRGDIFTVMPPDKRIKHYSIHIIKK